MLADLKLQLPQYTAAAANAPAFNQASVADYTEAHVVAHERQLIPCLGPGCAHCLR